MTLYGYKEKKAQLPFLCKGFGVGGHWAILLFLVYLWNNQCNWADDCLVSALHFWLRSLFLQLAPICAMWQGTGKHSASLNSRIQPTLSFPLPIWFLRNLPRVVARGEKRKEERKETQGKGFPPLTLQTTILKNTLFSLGCLAPLR